MLSAPNAIPGHSNDGGLTNDRKDVASWRDRSAFTVFAPLHCPPMKIPVPVSIEKQQEGVHGGSGGTKTSMVVIYIYICMGKTCEM